MSKIFFIALIFVTTVISVEAISTLINAIEEKIFRIVFSDCTKVQHFLGYQYENVASEAYRKTSNMFLNLYAPLGQEIHYLHNAAQTLIASPNFIPQRRTVIISHGYFGDSNFGNPIKLANELKSLGNLNVLTLDHSALTRTNYFLASTNTRYAGEALGTLLASLHALGVRDFHLIGHSIGAHLSGFAGKIYQKTTGDQIQRITALDAAGPCFYHEVKEKRLDKNDAIFVDVIHTDIDALGITIPIGHADFYPNSGRNMPGCLIFCGHVRAFEYFIESVNQNRNGFLSVKCESWDNFTSRMCSSNPRVPMGYWLPSSIIEGLYYLKTTIDPPYGIGEGGIA